MCLFLCVLGTWCGGKVEAWEGWQAKPCLGGRQGQAAVLGPGTSGWPFDWAWGGGDRLICLAVSWEPLGQVLGPPASPSQLWALSWSGPCQTFRAMDRKSKVWCPVGLETRPSNRGRVANRNRFRRLDVTQTEGCIFHLRMNNPISKWS